MKTIIISIRPEWVAKILNGEKTIEVRKGLALYNALKRGEDVEFLMYVTKGNPRLYGPDIYKCFHAVVGKGPISKELNGKVVARFKTKAEVIREIPTVPLDLYEGEQNFTIYILDDMDSDELLKESCLSDEQMFAYLHDGKDTEEKGTALHIRDLEIFDKPKTLADYGLKRSPQSWGYTKKGGLNGES